MSTLQRISAATDLSAPARHAVEREFQLAQQHQAQLNVLHVRSQAMLHSLRQWLGGEADAAEQQLLEDAEQALQRMVAQTHFKPAGTAQTQLLIGSPVDVIADQVAQSQCQLLVLGAHGEDFLQPWRLGSTTSRLLRKIRQCPVLVVKQTPRNAYARVLVAVDDTALAAQVLAQAHALAPQADLLLLHCVATPFEGKLRVAGVSGDAMSAYRAQQMALAEQRLQTLLAQTQAKPERIQTMVRAGNASEQILRLEQDFDADLTVVGHHGDSLATDLLLGSNTKHLLHSTQGDVLVVGA